MYFVLSRRISRESFKQRLHKIVEIQSKQKSLENRVSLRNQQLKEATFSQLAYQLLSESATYNAHMIKVMTTFYQRAVRISKTIKVRKSVALVNVYVDCSILLFFQLDCTFKLMSKAQLLVAWFQTPQSCYEIIKEFTNHTHLSTKKKSKNHEVHNFLLIIVAQHIVLTEIFNHYIVVIRTTRTQDISKFTLANAPKFLCVQ